jgi:hypothetical protein
MSDPSGRDRFVARAKRFGLSIELMYREPGRDERWSRGHVQNVSRSGVAFRGERALPAGSLVELTFDLPGVGTAIICQGRLVRSFGEGTGAAGMAIAITRYRLKRRAVTAVANTNEPSEQAV